MKEDKKVVMNGGQNTKHAVSATHVERQVEKKAKKLWSLSGGYL